MDLPSVLGGLAQGFVDFGKSAVDLFGTGGAAFADLIQGTGTKNQDDFRKWLYQTDSVKDAAAKGLGTALNGVQTISDYIPGVNVLTRNPLGNTAQGALGGLADEFKMAGENYDLGRAGQRAAVSGAAALAGSSLGDALKKSASPLLRSGLAQGLARGATGGAINQGGYAAIDGGDVMQGALQGAGLGALIGGATGAVQDFIPHKQTYRPETLDDVLATDDIVVAADMEPEGMAVNAVAPGTKRLYRGLSQEYDPNYPTNKLDTSGYESWTDNPELARQYGKNVYYTDVPESAIKTSYMDENPQSETYGDRNLWHSITKPAGLNGVSGTEYLLYMDDPASRSLVRNRLQGGGTLDAILADADMAVNAAREPEGFTYDYDGSDLAAVQRAYNLATQDQVKLDGILKEISDTLGTDFESAGQKSVKSMLDKIERKVRSGRDYTASSMKDHTRGKVMMHNFSEIPQVLQELDRRGVPYDTEVVTNDWGYKGYHITYRNPDGISSEIQLTTADHWPAKLESDAIYDEWRNFNLDASTKTERQRYNEAMAKSQALWAKVDFNDFDKTVQSLSDTGRASRSVAPVTLKSGLTQEPSLYTKMPSSSESASMSPSSVTRTFSGTGFDKSPNIDTPPFRNIIPQNTSRTLEGVLSADDLKVNSAKIAPGQLGLFDDMPTQTPKTGTRQVSLFDQPQEGLDYYGGDIENPEPVNPYAPVDGKFTDAMKQRYSEVVDDYLRGNITKNDLYDKINPDTMPKKGIDVAAREAADLKPKARKEYIEKALFGDGGVENATTEQLLDVYFSANSTSRQNMLDRIDRIKNADYYMPATKEYMLKNTHDYYVKKVKTAINKAADATSTRGGHTGAYDTILSERLGIAPGNTNKRVAKFDMEKSAFGRYRPDSRDIATQDSLNPENTISTTAHERLHSFQGEADPGSAGRYNQEVVDAYNELRNDLRPLLHSRRQISKDHPYMKDYYASRIEQESRMLQDYLDANGYTNSIRRGRGEYGAEIKPAFDKFFDKLRDLSKRGVALPAITGLIGGGAVLEQILNGDKEDKKKTNKRSA